MVGAIAAAARAAEGSDIETVKRRVVADLLTKDLSGNEAKDTPDAGRKWGDTLRADGTWPDVDYADRTQSGAWGGYQHLIRMQEVARASRLPGGKALKPKAIAALDHWLTKDYSNPNWWWREIGVPRAMGRILLLLEADLSAAQRKKGLEILARARVNTRTGQNRVWLSGVAFMRACLEKDAALATKALKSITAAVRTTTREGIQPDWSFHQHGPCLYSGGYGLGFSVDCARFAYYTHGTRFAFSEDQMKILSSYLLDGQCWMTRGHRFDYSACGREITRKDREHTGRSVGLARSHSLGLACAYMAKIPGPQQAKFAVVAEPLGSAETGVEGEPSGNRYFWRSAFMVHRRPAYYVSMRMARKNLLSTDLPCIGEGRRSHYLSDGVTYILRSGTEYDLIFGVWDWRRPPGVTNRADAPLKGNVNVSGARTFAGAASDGTFGVAAMDWTNMSRGKGYPPGQLSARKAWFCFEREVVCLGAGITCKGEHPVITSVNQCHLRGEVATSAGTKRPGVYELSGPAWVHHDGVGYVFPEKKARVHLAPGPQTGSWRNCNIRFPAEKETLNVFNLWIDHGTRPQGEGYVYHLVPGIEAKDMPAYLKDSGVEVLSNTPALQAVRHKRLKITGAAFYAPGKLEVAGGPAIAVDKSCIVLVRELAAGKFRVTFCKPDAAGKNPDPVAVTVNGRKIKINLPTRGETGRSIPGRFQ